MQGAKKNFTLITEVLNDEKKRKIYSKNCGLKLPNITKQKSQQKHLFQPAINKKKVGMKMRFTFFKHLQLHYLIPTYCRYSYKYLA